MVKKKGKGAKAMDTGDGGESYTYGPSVAGGGAKVRVSSPQNKINNLPGQRTTHVLCFYCVLAEEANNQALAQTKIAKRQAERARRGARRPARQEGAAGREEAGSAIDGQGVVVAVLFVACCVCACQISLPTRFLKRHASRTLTSSQCTGAREPID